ncbi:transcription cofactor vestigial-like protein 2a isoform X1 [Stegostoma tigrinum]|uniref:transcription cofactor vestigial-like protein 2a isoform X1 n=1 Tax=Stegostoma tigrinum TaxID=3053191 RepID=UPI00202ACFBF|nr:transcription cofactor vestigial-like protein 2a isoform X1 [Stegostoma tigrinum]XP_048387434.1 transcription cofactor vestigial-like protein 2a isoform X1 [Stegostoma tigrinum]XP_048387435.1 transcription cofactor vestigial-like protein 2a isoform X1 [Stegostoma tigrinum]XP_059501722.1 transcription cofactor vestigial-like protein 2a isoform X1 [Stegostoma tigrinum]
MSCLDVMYQVYGPQPYFTAAYSPYHHQKLAFYSKMQEAADSTNISGSFSVHGSAIKEEELRSEKERPPEAEYLSSRCVLFTYFQGDISSVVDEHFTRALSQPSSYTPVSSDSKASRGNTSSWRDGAFPMNQRSFPPSFWNSAYQPSMSASLSSSLGSALAGAPTELPFGADPYSSASLHTHLHQGAPEPWHHHHYSLGSAINTQSSVYTRPSMHDVYGMGTPFDPRYSSLLVPSVRPHRFPAVPTPQCDLVKSDTASAWTTGAFTGPTSDMSQTLNLNVDAGLAHQEKNKDLYWF